MKVICKDNIETEQIHKLTPYKIYETITWKNVTFKGEDLISIEIINDIGNLEMYGLNYRYRYYNNGEESINYESYFQTLEEFRTNQIDKII